jgi:TRAP-type C4-dicarboxylate transport system substrate-binding protein
MGDRMTRLSAAVAVWLGLAGAAAGGTELTLSSWVGPSHPINYGGLEPFIAAVEADPAADITFQFFSGGALLGPRTTLDGVSTGIADAGIVALTYHPAEFPHGQLIAELAMASRDPMTAAAAVSEFNLLHCAPCLAEFAAQGMVYTGTYSTTPYVVISRRPFAIPDDFAGLRLRTPGAMWNRWAEHLGAVPVALPSTDMYEGLERGIIDVALQPAAALRSYGLWDVATHVTLLDLGTYHSLALIGFGTASWQDLATGQRRALLDAMPIAMVGATQAYLDLDAEIISAAAAKNIEISQPSAALLADRDAFAIADLARIIAIARERYGIANPAAIIDHLQALFAEWETKLDPVRDDPEAIKALFRQEIFDHIDAETFGR